MIIEVIGLVLLGLIAFGALSIAGSFIKFLDVYRAPPLEPGDIVWIQSFGTESRCVVREIAGNVVIVDHFPVENAPDAP